MKIKSITLDNFKVYNGNQRIETNIDSFKKPLVLIGGNNGAGKTSIIEAIKLCLHGEHAKQLQIGYTSYNSFLSDMHNRLALKKGNKTFSISISLEIIESGMPSNMLIKREWTLINKRYRESFLLKREGEDLEFIDKEYWQDYINELTPRGLSDLIFFDSEEFRRVPQYLEDGFIPSLLSYFGIDIYQKLSKDLRRYSIHTESKTNPELENEILQYESEIELVKAEVESISSEKNKLQIELDNLKIEHENIRDRLRIRSGKRAEKRDEIIDKKEKINKKLDELNNEYIDICSKDLPFTFCKDLINELIDELKSGIDIDRFNSSLKFVESFKNNFLSNLKEEYDSKTLTNIKKTFKESLPKNSSKSKLHDISESQALTIIDLLENKIKNNSNSLNNNRNSYNNLEAKRSKINRDLREIQPDGPDKALYDTLTDNEKSQNKLEFEISYIPNRIEKKERIINSLSQKISIAENKFEKSNALGPKVNIANKAKNLIDEYSEYLLNKRFLEFRKHFLDISKKMTTKEDVVCDISIDIKENKMLFWDQDMKELSIKAFSAGESEIVALSLLWAINKTAGKNHPIVTDSPFNRLDKKHRENFVKHFIKESSNQIIFLSTDEEFESIDDFGIKKYMDSSLVIEHNYKNKTSKVDTGYFK